MGTREQKHLYVFCIVALLVNFIIQIQASYISGLRRYAIYKDSLYIPNRTFLPVVTLHYDMFFADLLWLRSIQAFGGHFSSGDRNYRPVYDYFDVITDLDPRFTEAYRFGNLVIGDEGQDYERASTLLEKGIIEGQRFAPHVLDYLTYKLSHEGLFLFMHKVKDLKKAKWYVRMLQKADDCPDYIIRIEAYLDKETGGFQIAFEKYLYDYCDKRDNYEHDIRSIILNNMYRVINDWNINQLQTAARKYKEQKGKDITDLYQLMESNLLEPYTIYSIDNIMKRIEYHESKQEKLTPHFEEILEGGKITQVGIPRDPWGYFYFIVRGKTSESDNFIFDAYSTIEPLRRFLADVENDIQWYKDTYGKAPLTLDELYLKKTDKKFEEEEPYGNEWIYDPVAGTIRSGTIPWLTPAKIENSREILQLF